MSTSLTSAAIPVLANRLTAALNTFKVEAVALLSNLLNPRDMLRDIDRMQALFVEANRVSASDPQRAEALRRVAAGMFLR